VWPLGAGSGTQAPPDAGAIRPDAPPEFDVLVAQQLALDGHDAEATEAYLRAVAKDPDSANLNRRAAMALAQQNRLEESLGYASRASALDPEDEESRLFLAQLYRVERRTGDAEATLTKGPGQPISYEAAFLLYQVYLDAGRLDDALTTANWMVEQDPEDQRGTIAVATAYQRMERTEDAERSLREAIARDPENLRLRGTLARMLRQRGAYQEEAELYREMLGKHPDHHATLVALGEAQQALGDTDGAIATFEKVERRYPTDLSTSIRLGYLYFDAKRYREARERFEHVLAEKPAEYDVWFFLGVVARREGDVDGSIAAFASIPEDHRFYPEARAQIASVHERRGKYKDALAEVEKALAVRDTQEIRVYSATLRAKSGDLDGAVAEVEAMLEEEPDNDELLFNLGVVYGEAKRTDDAIRYMQKALEKNPDNASALNYIGYTWAEKGVNLDEAERMIRRAIELRPDDGYIVDSLGWVYYMRARPLVQSGRTAEAQPYLDRAIEELERAHELTGGDPVISEHLGDAYLLLNRKELALEKFQEALRLEPREGEQPHLLRKFETLQRELR
jgi:tetratricopeptide (TPR) repeat protein